MKQDQPRAMTLAVKIANRMQLNDSLVEHITASQKIQTISEIFAKKILAHPGNIEKEMIALKNFKKKSAVIGLFLPCCCGPCEYPTKTSQAKSAKEALALFEAARRYINYEFNNTQVVRQLNQFYTQLNDVSNNVLNEMVKDASDPKSVIKPTPEETENQRNFNKMIARLSIEEIAGILTLANFIMPKSFDKEAFKTMTKTGLLGDGINNITEYLAKKMVTIEKYDFMHPGIRSYFFGEIDEQFTSLIQQELNKQGVIKAAHR